jgi:uncharacterized protein YbbK (DUF523 family)
MKTIYLVSACLVGVNCRFDGQNTLSRNVVSFLADKNYIPLCPEQLGGLPTPRPPCRFFGGDGRDVLLGTARLIDENGEDKTPFFLKGSHETITIAQLTGATHTLFKERSPSCGVREVYSDGVKILGMGVTTAALVKHDISVISEDDV